MIYQSRCPIIIVMLLLLVGLSACTQVDSHSSERPFSMVHGSYPALSLEERAQLADYVAAATVVSISDTQWNQDTGEYWEVTIEDRDSEGGFTERAISVYDVTVVLDTVLAGDAPVGETVVLTLGGVSPNQVAENELYADSDTYDWQVGDEIVAFFFSRQIPWRDPGVTPHFVEVEDNKVSVVGTREIMALGGPPSDAFLVKGDDGLYHSQGSSLGYEFSGTLNDLAARVQEARAAASE